MPWHIEEVTTADFAGVTRKSFAERFRDSRPKLLVFKLKKLPWTGVVKVAPLESALCALADDLPAYSKALCQWVSPYIDSEETYRAFLAELKQAGMTRHTVPRELFSPYTTSSGYGGKASREFSKDDHFLGYYRFSAAVTDNAFTTGIIEFYKRQLEQFASLAFVSAPEGTDRANRPPSLDISGELLLFRHVMRSQVNSDSAHEAALCESLGLLETAIARLESGRGLQLALHYTYLVRPPVGLLFTEYGEFGCPRNSLEERVILARARFFRLLAWPQIYNSILIRRQSLVEAAIKLSAFNEFVQKLLHEIELIIKVLEGRYPVLTENPMEKADQK